ncbi:Hpt domain-containing protein [Parvularcula marina]|jgi:HPt (histidine-containing phosphotransfer) domain-containing protein|uniref:Hpt domain-containing protein n=2 Tax=Parvularcula marina TaxID=2292771 RepID=UPI0035168CD4
MGQLSMIDVKHLDRYVAGDRALRDEILAIYEEQVETWVSMLDPTAGDDAWRDAAHALKGASRGVGAWELGDLCASAEEMIGGAADVTKRTEVVTRLREILTATIDDVRRLRTVQV